MSEFLLGLLLGQRSRPLPSRPSLAPGGRHTYRPLQAWAYVVGRAAGRLVRRARCLVT
jgi:hypothetical protein